MRVIPLLIPVVLLASAAAFATPPEARNDRSTASVAAPLAETPALPGLTGDDTTGSAAEPGAPKKRFPLGAIVIYENAVGAGTFLSDAKMRRPLWEMSLSMRPFWTPLPGFKVGLRLDVAKEVITNAETTDTFAHQTTLSDTFLTVSHNDIWAIPVVDIHIGAYNEFLFPSSLESQYRNRYLTWRLGLTLWRQFGPVNLTYQFRFAKHFCRIGNPTVDMDDFGHNEYDQPNMSYRDADLWNGDPRTGDNNPDFDIMNRLVLTWDIWGGLALGIDYAIFNSWTMNSYPFDELSGTGASAGRGQTDATLGTVELSYQIIDQLAVALGVSSYQPPKKADNSGFRPPFFNFYDAGNNYTSVYFDVVGTF